VSEVTLRHSHSSLPGLTPQVGFTRLAALNNAQLGQARVAVQSTIFRNKMDARVNGVPADCVGGVPRPAHDTSIVGNVR